MLEIVKFNEDEYDFPCLLVLGCFDGIHTGHTELLKKAKLQAKINGLDLGVMLFADGKGEKQIYTFEERLALLEQFNVKFVLKIDFTEDIKKIKPLEFLSVLEEKLNIKAYMSGKDFKFGAGKKGKASTLKSYAEDEENGVWYLSVKEVTDGDGKISTSVIKEMLENGDLANANRLLGRNFSLKGMLENGKLSYPQEKIRLKSGAYKVKCTAQDTEYECLTNCNSDNNVLEFEGLAVDGGELTVEFLELAGGAVIPEAEETVAELAVADETENDVQSAEETVEEAPVEDFSDDGLDEIATEEQLEEAVIEEVAEPVVEQPAEEVNETLEETVEEPAEESAEDPFIEPVVEQSAEEAQPAEVIGEQPDEQSAEETAEVEESVSAEEAVEESTEQLSEEMQTEEAIAEPEDGQSGQDCAIPTVSSEIAEIEADKEEQTEATEDNGENEE